MYALTLEKSDAAPEAILKLSGMMRYVVTESDRDEVPLESEIAYINNYISLQKLRMDNETGFTLIIKGDAKGKSIPPLLLIPFIENAFKYGLSPEERSDITIGIDIRDAKLIMNVKNNKVKVQLPEDQKSGHGIENAKMRLEYLYPDKYDLAIFDKKDVFEVQLTIQFV